MTNVVLLNNVDHQDLRVRLDGDPSPDNHVNQTLIFPTEFEDAQREFPILLRKNGEGRFHAVALLGLDRDENLFLGERGWTSRYVPAIHQRGPFKIGLPSSGEDGAEAMVHVDLDSPLVGTDTGEPLFLPQGGNAPYLDHVTRVLRRIHDGHELAPRLYAALDAEGLLAPVALRISLDDTTHYDVPNCYSIGAEQLGRLDGAALDRLNRAGFLRAAFLISASLGNVVRLIELKNARRRGMRAA